MDEELERLQLKAAGDYWLDSLFRYNLGKCIEEAYQHGVEVERRIWIERVQEWVKHIRQAIEDGAPHYATGRKWTARFLEAELAKLQTKTPPPG